MVDILRTLKITKEPKKLIAEILVTDLASNKYASIRLPPITISASDECTVSFYQLLKRSGAGKK
jgi:hypothetical protein